MKLNNSAIILVLLIIVIPWHIAKCEYASALVDLEPLLATQGAVIKALESYLKFEEKRLKHIKHFKEEYDKLNKSASKDANEFLSNPINAYLLVKRLMKDWKIILNLTETSSSKDFMYNVTKREIFPNEDDLVEAASAVVRLQDTYLLDTSQLANGEIKEIKGTFKLAASDCFELGLGAFHVNDFNRTLLWMQETLKILKDEDFRMVNMSKLLDHMAYSSYKLGNVQSAMELTNQLIVVDPNHSRAHNNLRLFKKELSEYGEKSDSNLKHRRKHMKETKMKIIHKERNFENCIETLLNDKEKYKKLCRGENLRTPVQERKLKCRYTSRGSKYLLLQPMKEETLNLDPWIVVYHDVIRDNDIEILKEISEHLLQRATVWNPETGRLDFAGYRVSKSGWLADEVHPRVAHISLLLKEITGLETSTSEFLQINKYGLGGYYEGHFDFRMPGALESYPEFGTGNRIATWLFYLSDVDAGGSTVFPIVDVKIKPIKGSAGFWFNLNKNGKGDYRTGHAACPVLSGIKWVANKWFHEKDQEFRRPCSLIPDE